MRRGGFHHGRTVGRLGLHRTVPIRSPSNVPRGVFLLFNFVHYVHHVEIPQDILDVRVARTSLDLVLDTLQQTRAALVADQRQRQQRLADVALRVGGGSRPDLPLLRGGTGHVAQGHLEHDLLGFEDAFDGVDLELGGHRVVQLLVGVVFVVQGVLVVLLVALVLEAVRAVDPVVERHDLLAACK